MKLSFATGGWPFSLEECMDMAREMHYDGLEISVESLSGFEKAGAPFSPAHMNETVRQLHEEALQIACITAHPGWSGEAVETLIRLAHDLRSPFVAIPVEEAAEEAKEKIAPVLPLAERLGVALLIPSIGCYADTGVLKTLLDHFASDFLGAVWDVPCAAAAGKSPEEIVTDLGAYIRHVHLCDGVKGKIPAERKLLGEGNLPLSDVFAALRSISFDGFFSFVWQPGEGALGDADVVFSHYAAVARNIGKDPRRAKHRLYDNKRGTGK